MSKSNNKLPVRIDKTLNWLEKSRNSWKEKTTTSKYELQKQKIAVKRARKGRDLLHEELSEEKAAHCKTQSELIQKEAEIVECKAQLQKANQQVEEFKKKSLLRELVGLATTHTGTAS